jgi:hypothetical protein
LRSLSLFLSLGKHSYETEHAIDEMGTDSTDHEIGTPLRKLNDFDPVSDAEGEEGRGGSEVRGSSRNSSNDD